MHITSKTILAALATGLLAVTVCRAETPISKGDTPEQVQKAAGEPIGRMNHGGKVVWLYHRGDVTFVDGRVVELSWLTEEELAERTRIRRERTRAADEARKREAPQATTSHSPPSAHQKILIYHPQFTRKPSPSAKYAGDIPVEFERILLPKVWVQGRNVQVGRYTGKSRTKALKGVAAALAKYPDGLAESTLNTIYMPSTLVMAGDQAGGLADFETRSVCITSSQAFHHEFAHILHYSFWKLFPHKEWTALNGKSYTSDGRIVRTNHSPNQTYGSPWYHDNGFVNRYAMVSIFEDFAETFGIAFGRPEVMTRIQRNSEPISKKLDLLVQFLNDIIKVTSGRESLINLKNILDPTQPDPGAKRPTVPPAASSVAPSP